jgi:hypothetical protein
VRPLIVVALSGLAVVALLASFLVVFQMARAGDGNKANTGPVTGRLTPTSGDASPSAQPEGTTTLAPSPTAAPHLGMRITQNQDMRPLCVEDPRPYTVKLTNNGASSANWSIVFPVVQANVQQAKQITGSASSPMSPHSPSSASPVWGVATPANGTLAAGQTASFSINVVWGMPCGGTTYRATVKVSGQADLPLTYAGTGPARYSNVVVTANENYMESCPDGVAPPPPYTVSLKNTGNYRAYIFFLVIETTPLGDRWVVPMPDPASSWIEANGTMTITMTPQSWITCNGKTYNVRVTANSGGGQEQEFFLTDTVN